MWPNYHAGRPSVTLSAHEANIGTEGAIITASVDWYGTWVLLVLSQLSIPFIFPCSGDGNRLA